MPPHEPSVLGVRPEGLGDAEGLAVDVVLDEASDGVVEGQVETVTVVALQLSQHLPSVKVARPLDLRDSVSSSSGLKSDDLGFGNSSQGEPDQGLTEKHYV